MLIVLQLIQLPRRLQLANNRIGIKKLKKKVAQGKVREDTDGDAMQQLALETIAVAEAVGVGSEAAAEEAAEPAKAKVAKTGKRPSGDGTGNPGKKVKKS